MATDTTGFRSLVQQIQERDHAFEPQAPVREARAPQAPVREARESQANGREPQAALRETREPREPRVQREPREPRRDLPRRTRGGRTDGMGVTFSNASAKGDIAGTLLGRRWL